MKKIILTATVIGLCLSLRTFAEGPVTMGGSWYYMNTEGETVKECFVPIDGRSYYFGTDGRLLSCCTVSKDGDLYGLDENGAMLKNAWGSFAKDGRQVKMYFGYQGKAFQDGWLTLGNKTYHFTESVMDHGWFTDDYGNVYFLGGADDGSMHTGWLIWKGEELPGSEMHIPGWYYFQNGSGVMTADREIQIQGEYYAFGENGSEVSGFCTMETNGHSEEKYYDPETGKRKNGWEYVDAYSETEGHPEGWYYFINGIPLNASRSGVKLSDNAGTVCIDNQYYAFEENGKMITGLIRADNGKYYVFGNDGIMMTGYLDMTPFGVEQYLLFETEGKAPPYMGGTVSGLRDGRLYENGKLITAEKDRFEMVSVMIGEEEKSFIVSADGRVVRSGTVCLENGRLMKIISENGSYIWHE